MMPKMPPIKAATGVAHNKCWVIPVMAESLEAFTFDAAVIKIMAHEGTLPMIASESSTKHKPNAIEFFDFNVAC